MRTAILIPARLESSRFPEKMLTNLGGKPLIRRVYDRCLETGYDTYVVTDSKKIASLCDNHVMTSPDHDSGTSRCSEAAAWLDYDAYINVQGDMPDVTKSILLELEKIIYDGIYEVATLSTVLTAMDIDQSNTVKVIRTQNEARWFTRQPIDYGEKHLGVYGFTARALSKFEHLKTSKAEKSENLEQLRWLTNGYEIGAKMVDFIGQEINTIDDLNAWRMLNN